MPQVVIAGSYTVAGQVVEVYTSLAAVTPWLWLTKRVKLSELAQIGPARTGLAQAELAQTELARAELVWTELAQAELVGTELVRAELVETELVRTELV